MHIAVLCLTASPEKISYRKAAKFRYEFTRKGLGTAALEIFVWMGLTTWDTFCPWFSLGFCETRTHSNEHNDAMPSVRFTNHYHKAVLKWIDLKYCVFFL